MNEDFQAIVLEATGASRLIKREEIQSLWSGYGSISRFQLTGSDYESIVIKHVKLPDQQHHPRGWNTDFSHQRKIRSYHVETAWYGLYSQTCDDACRVPACIAYEASEDEFLMVLEDLDAAGFAQRITAANRENMRACLKWLAYFHATFMGKEPEQLWQLGTYWHLDTRPDELAALDDLPLKNAADKIDELLKNAPYQTFVHGDAKLANFCFSPDSDRVAAVDFQYVGGGCGMKDVAYFIGSCLHEEDCKRYEQPLLDDYFSYLKIALQEKQPGINPVDVESAWRPLFAVAWTDFHRFVKGWSPGHWKIHDYSERLSRQVLANLA